MRKVITPVLAGLLALAPVTGWAKVKVGFTGVLSGPAAALGQDQVDGFNLALAQTGGTLGGQEAELVTGDDQLNPGVGTQVIREMIESERVDALVGLGFSNVLMAGLPHITESGTVAIATNAGPSPVAGAQCASNVFSVAWQNDGAAEAMGKLVQDKGYDNVYLMAPNYQAGKDMITGFKRFYKGGVADELYTQVNQPDYSAEIAQLQIAMPDALFVFYPGGMGVNVLKQLSQTGLLATLPVYSVFTVDGTTLPAQRNAALNVVTGAMWSPALDTPENTAFVAAFKQAYGRTPSLYAATGYDAARLLDKAVGDLGGDVSDKAALAKAVKAAGSTFTSVRGPFSFGANNMPVQNYYAFRVVPGDDGPRFEAEGVPLPEHKDAYGDLCPGT